jgi:hypothetical protein
VTVGRLAGTLLGCAAVGAAVATTIAVASGGGDGPFVRSDSKRSAVIWAVGDGADGGPAAGSVVDLIERSRADRVLYLGDVYDRGTAAEYQQRYAASWGRLAPITAPTPGNHEWPRRLEGYLPYWAGVRGGRTPARYSFRTAGWEVLSLNSEAPHDPGSAQVRWLRRALSGPGNCRIAFWHRPRFSAGGHGDQADTDPLWRPLRGHARIAVWGHDHHMQRLRSIGGVLPFVSGAGGHGLYGVDRSDPRLAFGDDSHYGALRLRLRPGLARWAFVSARGHTLDSGSARCHARGR